MKSSRSNFDLRAPSSYLARSYLIATVKIMDILMSVFIWYPVFNYSNQEKLLNITFLNLDHERYELNNLNRMRLKFF